jgi:hypothetical protein
MDARPGAAAHGTHDGLSQTHAGTKDALAHLAGLDGLRAAHTRLGRTSDHRLVRAAQGDAMTWPQALVLIAAIWAVAYVVSNMNLELVFK